MTNSLRGQRGVMLIIALVMLLTMTVIGITTMTNSTLQERMANNARQSAQARLNAESALREAEDRIAGLAINKAYIEATFGNNATAGYYLSHATSSFVDAAEPSWALNDSTAWSGASTIPASNSSSSHTSEFIIEYIGRYQEQGLTELSLDFEDKNKDDDLPYVFRITAIGYGENQNIYSVLQSTYMTEQGSP